MLKIETVIWMQNILYGLFFGFFWTWPFIYLFLKYCFIYWYFPFCFSIFSSFVCLQFACYNWDLNTCTCSIYYLLLLFFALTFVLTCSCNDHMLHWFWSMLLRFFKNVVLNFPVELKQLIIWVLALLLRFPDFNFYPLSVHIPMYSYYVWCMLLVFIIYDWLVY